MAGIGLCVAGCGSEGRLRVLGDSLTGFPNIGYRDARLTQLARQFFSTMIPERQDSLFREIWPILQADAPVLVLWPQVFYTAAHRPVKGMESPHRVFAVSHMDELWLEDTAAPAERGGR